MTAKDIYEKRNNIIPVIGENSFFYYPDNGGRIPLQNYLVDKIIEKQIGKKQLKHPEDLPVTQMRMKGFYGLSLCRQQCGFSKDEQYLQCYNRIIEEAKGKIHLDDTVKEFLERYKFHMIITTNCFDFIETDLPWYKSKVYVAARGANNKEEIEENEYITYHIFGKSGHPSIWAWDEESLMSILHCHHDNDTAPTGLQRYIYPDQNSGKKSKSLLVLHSNLPDWLFRFFLYPLAYKDKWVESGFYLNSDNRAEGSLKNFIENVICYYIEESEVEQVLRDSLDFLSDNNEIMGERIPHGKKYDIFISYAQQDYQLAMDLKNKLESPLFGLRIWLDRSGGIEDGDYTARMREGIENSAYFMPLLTKQYKEKLSNANYEGMNSMLDVLNDDKKSSYIQKEAWAANIQYASLKKDNPNIKAYSLPILFSSQGINYSQINACVELGQLPQNLFGKVHIFDEEEIDKKDWSRYKTTEK
ncbi:MAG: toll/interleukin-1 receptor domain-containing protein [Prevotella sp.]|nr:toll/interleukin-1 receptor domain-containing protein [Prevotella sp.]